MKRGIFILMFYREAVNIKLARMGARGEVELILPSCVILLLVLQSVVRLIHIKNKRENACVSRPHKGTILLTDFRGGDTAQHPEFFLILLYAVFATCLLPSRRAFLLGRWLFY
jgi:hypothetical protein